MKATFPRWAMIAALVCLFSLEHASTAPSVDEIASRLRTVARLPSMPITVASETASTTEAGREAELKQHYAALKGTEEDAALYMKIGDLQVEQTRKEEAQAAFQRAAEMFRKRLSTRPGDGTALAGLSRALVTQKNFDEAEKTARMAVEVDPTNGHGWAALGFNLMRRALHALNTSAMPGSPEFLDVVTRKASNDQVKQAVVVAEEAVKCMDKAVALVPTDVAYYEERPPIRMLRDLLGLRLTGEPITQAKVTGAVWSIETLNDHKRAAELKPECPDTVLRMLYYEVGKAAMLQELDWERVKRENGELIRVTMSRLGTMSESTNRNTALSALRWMGIIHMFMTNLPAAEQAFRRIIERDPAADFAWDGLAGIYFSTTNGVELVKLNEARVKAADSARNRILLAKAYELAGTTDKVEPQVRKALELEPNNVIANLSLAVLMLRQSKTGEAQDLLQKVRAIENSETQFTKQLAYVQGLYWGIKGMRFMAQIELKKATDEKSPNEQAEEALAVLSGK